MTSTNDETEPVAEVSTRDLDEFFDLLAAKRRRLTLYYLEHCADDWADVAEVADYLDRRNSESEPNAIAVDLHHNHLPRLERAGVAEFDDRSGTIRYHGHDLFEAWLDRVAEIDDG